ncbi:lytic transglycosylase [Paracoccus aestuariivivens]|uniref:Lytic transglycosylase n=1 Tax=Paracoccus aestuariivivens TaxID=1820333 RepID=A0A6L6JHM3_9RHOB|nr:lytic transglycosylase [Paracoccus aestuariivivens]MTH80047.1 lytic transglycosylase [Paracoccus aestuariivivens]
MNRFLKLAIVGLVASCGGGGNYKAPRNLENACHLAAERPAYMRAMKATERRWGIPVYVQMATIHQESKFIGDAKTPHRYALGIIPMGRQSSAYGYSQALDGTWDDYRKETGNRSARRDDIRDATDFMGWYMHNSTRILGISKQDAASQYLAYHEGRAGFANGSHRGKPSLMSVSNKVSARSELYRMQLTACR